MLADNGSDAGVSWPWFVTCLCPTCTMCLVRQKVREKVGISGGSIVEDVVTMVCCGACGNCQMRNELMKRGQGKVSDLDSLIAQEYGVRKYVSVIKGAPK